MTLLVTTLPYAKSLAIVFFKIKIKTVLLLVFSTTGITAPHGNNELKLLSNWHSNYCQIGHSIFTII